MPHLSISLRAELKDTLKLAGPIVLIQLGHMSMAWWTRSWQDTSARMRWQGWASRQIFIGPSPAFAWLPAGAGYLFLPICRRPDERALARILGNHSGPAHRGGRFGHLHRHGPFSLSLAGAGERHTGSLCRLHHNIIWCLPSLFIFFVLQRYCRRAAGAAFAPSSLRPTRSTSRPAWRWGWASGDFRDWKCKAWLWPP